MNTKILLLGLFIILFTGCDKFPLQTDDDYNPKKIDIYQHMDCWEFINSRQDILSNMKEAIIKCELQSYYSQSETTYTYLLLNNDAFTNYILKQLNVFTVEEADKDELTDILLYHIVKGNYHAYGTLNYDPIHVITCWNNINAEMTMKLIDGKSSSTDQDRLVLMDQCGKSTLVTAVTSNLIMTNGPAHVLARNCVYVSN